MGVVTEHRELIPLSGACRVTCRTSSVLKAWQRSGSFQEGEWVVDESRTQGSGHPILVDLHALEREHRRRGGSEWHPQLAYARNLPQQMTGYVDSLRARVHALEAELARVQSRSSLAITLPTPVPDRSLPFRGESPTRPVKPRPSPAAVLNYADPFPVRDGDRAVSCNRFGEWHGFTETTSALWYECAKNKRLTKVIDALDVQGEPWKVGRVKVRFILYSDGRREFLERFWHLSYVHACGREGCECASMPGKGRMPTATVPPMQDAAVPVLSAHGSDEPGVAS